MVLLKGWPHVFLVTTARIAAGQEVLLSYGTEEYWKTMCECDGELTELRRVHTDGQQSAYRRVADRLRATMRGRLAELPIELS